MWGAGRGRIKLEKADGNQVRPTAPPHLQLCMLTSDAHLGTYPTSRSGDVMHPRAERTKQNGQEHVETRSCCPVQRHHPRVVRLFPSRLRNDIPTTTYLQGTNRPLPFPPPSYTPPTEHPWGYLLRDQPPPPTHLPLPHATHLSSSTSPAADCSRSNPRSTTSSSTRTSTTINSAHSRLRSKVCWHGRYVLGQ